MYIGINNFNAFVSDHKPLHVFRIQQEIAYICTLHHTFKLTVYVSQFYFNVTNKVGRYNV